MNNRNDILKGKIETPKQILEMLGDKAKVADRMFQALWSNFLKNKGSISATYWYDEFNDPKAFNKFLMLLHKGDWITTRVEPKRNWAEIFFNENKLDKWVSHAEVLKARQSVKFKKYVLTDTAKETPHDTKTSKGIMDVGLTREGQTKQSASKFKYDTEMLIKYREAIVLNVTKSMRMLELEYGVFADDVDYASISTAIVDFHIANPDSDFCLGGHVSDSRGRAISSALRKVVT